MNTVAGTRFAVKPVVAALALAFSAVNAYADPTPTQLPGGGLIRCGQHRHDDQLAVLSSTW